MRRHRADREPGAPRAPPGTRGRQPPAELEEVVAGGDTVLVVIHRPGRDRAEARAMAGLNPDS